MLCSISSTHVPVEADNTLRPGQSPGIELRIRGGLELHLEAVQGQEDHLSEADYTGSSMSAGIMDHCR